MYSTLSSQSHLFLLDLYLLCFTHARPASTSIPLLVLLFLLQLQGSAFHSFGPLTWCLPPAFSFASISLLDHRILSTLRRNSLQVILFPSSDPPRVKLQNIKCNGVVSNSTHWLEAFNRVSFTASQLVQSVLSLRIKTQRNSARGNAKRSSLFTCFHIQYRTIARRQEKTSASTVPSHANPSIIPTPFRSLGVLSSVLALFSRLSHRFVLSSFCRAPFPLKRQIPSAYVSQIPGVIVGVQIREADGPCGLL